MVDLLRVHFGSPGRLLQFRPQVFSNDAGHLGYWTFHDPYGRTDSLTALGHRVVRVGVDLPAQHSRQNPHSSVVGSSCTGTRIRGEALDDSSCSECVPDLRISQLVVVMYPLIPWVGVMAVGYVFGKLYQKHPVVRKKLLLAIGTVATTLFIIIRAINFYGDPNPWSLQDRGLVYTILSFFNVTKYPPSLLFLLMTLGPAILALAFLESNNSREPIGVRKFFITFGRVPLFFYLLQWPTAHLISLGLHFAFGKPIGWLFQSPFDWNDLPRGLGFNLAVVYAAWIGGVLLLYPLCRWFANLKQRRRDWWLSYL